MSNGDLESRIRNLEDVEAIKQLMASYCVNLDHGCDADVLTGLFADGGVWEATTVGRGLKVEGKEAIHKFFSAAAVSIPFAVHMVMNPMIKVDGDKATAIWYLLQPNTQADDDRAYWGTARYDNDYVKVNGEWKIKHSRINSFFMTPFDQGWVKQRFKS